MIAGVSTTRVMFKIDQPWHPNFADPRSAEYEEIHKSITDQVVWKYLYGAKYSRMDQIKFVKDSL